MARVVVYAGGNDSHTPVTDWCWRSFVDEPKAQTGLSIAVENGGNFSWSSALYKGGFQFTLA
jgi:hypothetical protein